MGRPRSVGRPWRRLLHSFAHFFSTFGLLYFLFTAFDTPDCSLYASRSIIAYPNLSLVWCLSKTLSTNSKAEVVRNTHLRRIKQTTTDISSRFWKRAVSGMFTYHLYKPRSDRTNQSYCYNACTKTLYLTMPTWYMKVGLYGFRIGYLECSSKA